MALRVHHLGPLINDVPCIERSVKYIFIIAIPSILRMQTVLCYFPKCLCRMTGKIFLETVQKLVWKGSNDFALKITYNLIASIIPERKKMDPLYLWS